MARRSIGSITALLLTALLCAPAAAQQQTGQFALYRGTPQIASKVTLIRGNELDIVQFPRDSHTPITQYKRTENEGVHVILVRDDFRSFSHVHPREAGDGHFRVQVALDEGHRYYAFVGSRPEGYSPQVFRFTLQAGAPPHRVATTLDLPSTHAVAGPYRVAITNARLSAGKPKSISAHVTSDTGATVETQQFRGAQAHTIFIDPQTLKYVHVDAPGDDRHIVLRVPPLPRGAYRMWLEFESAGSIYAAPFTLVAQ